jgi:hypothetical protein
LYRILSLFLNNFVSPIWIASDPLWVWAQTRWAYADIGQSKAPIECVRQGDFSSFCSIVLFMRLKLLNRQRSKQLVHHNTVIIGPDRPRNAFGRAQLLSCCGP